MTESILNKRDYHPTSQEICRFQKRLIQCYNDCDLIKNVCVFNLLLCYLQLDNHNLPHGSTIDATVPAITCRHNNNQQQSSSPLWAFITLNMETFPRSLQFYLIFHWPGPSHMLMNKTIIDMSNGCRSYVKMEHYSQIKRDWLAWKNSQVWRSM